MTEMGKMSKSKIFSPRIFNPIYIIELNVISFLQTNKLIGHGKSK